MTLQSLRTRLRHTPKANWIGIAVAAILPACYILFMIAISLAGWTINTSSSMPIGLYRPLDRTPAQALRRGDIVSYCLPKGHSFTKLVRERHYLEPGSSCDSGLIPLLKQVYALPGDVVTIDTQGVQVNGVRLPNSKIRTVDRQGRPMPPLPHNRFVLRHGEAWLMALYNSASLDGRYIGPVRQADIKAILEPVWSYLPATD